MSAGSPPDDIEFTDTGLARARTRLAWTRSAVSFAAIGVVIVKDRPLAGAPLLVLGVFVLALGRLTRFPGDRSYGADAGAHRRVVLVTTGVIVVALTALAVALLGHSAQGLKL